VRLHRARRRLQRATDALLNNPDGLPGSPAAGGEPQPSGLTSVPAGIPRRPPVPGPLPAGPLHQERFTKEHTA